MFVGGLSRSVAEGELLRLFMPYGRIVKSDYCWHLHGPKKGEPRGFAFVEYETPAEAGKAIAALDGRELKGRRLQVRYQREQEAQPTDPRSFVSRKSKAAKGSGQGSSGPSAAASASSSSAGDGGGGGRASLEEGALEAKIRALKAMLQQPPPKR